MNPAATPARLVWALALVALLVLWFGGLEWRGLFQPDEGRYAEIPREMLASGDWVTPRLNGLKYFEKPPLQYWATAGSFAAFGRDEWSARLWPAVTGFLGILVLAFAGRRLGPPGAGTVAGLVLASSVGYFLAGQVLTLDMGLTFFLCAAMCAFLVSQQAPPGSTGARGWMLAAWAGMALAVLTKGLAGIVLPGLALAGYIAMQRDWARLRRLEWARGGAIFALIALPWHVLVQWRNPEFFRFYILNEHFARFLLPEHHRPGPWWYFTAILALALMPWVVLLPGVLRRLPPRAAREAFDVDRFLLVWAGTILVFFSVSASKLPGYIVPAMPAIALLIGRDVARRGGLDASRPGLLLAFCGAAAIAFGVPALVRSHVVGDIAVDYLPWFVLGAMALFIGGFVARALRSASSLGPALALAFTSLAGAQVITSGLHELDEQYSSESFVERMLGEETDFSPDPPFYSLAYFDDTLPFYLGRTLTLVAYRGELGSGIAAEPGKYVDSLDEFRRRWSAETEAYAVMKPELYARLRTQGLPMYMVALDPWRVVVSREPGNLPLRPRKPGALERVLRLHDT
ncbi:MAG: phospholipid carrier-dependent glycosyltransferase [Burkholderiales bacterium]